MSLMKCDASTGSISAAKAIHFAYHDANLKIIFDISNFSAFLTTKCVIIASISHP